MSTIFKRVKKNLILKAIKKTKKSLVRNTYYNNHDFNNAYKIFKDIINNNKKIKLLKKGNLKLNNQVMIYDLPSIITCKYACPSCYALKAERIYRNTRVMRLYHLLLNNFSNILFVYLINKELKHAKKNNIVRLHSSGDFYNIKYLLAWLTIILLNKHIYFYSYSKILNNFIINLINKIFNNFNIVKSLHKIDGKLYKNYGDDEYIRFLKNKIKHVYVCTYGQANQLTCMDNCKKCLNCPCVIFHKH